MDHEVVVVGGGIGGLTVAALLAARGRDVCLLEREPRVGGCVASFEKFGYTFEPGYGLYGSWQTGEMHDRLFAELPVDPPEIRLLEPSYVVRLPDRSEVTLTDNSEKFAASLRVAFPECAGAAVDFYRKLAALSAALRRALLKTPDLLSASTSRRAYSLLPQGRIGAEVLKSGQRSTLEQLAGTSDRFRRFVDVQLQALVQANSSNLSYLQAALTLSSPREGMFGIRGGGAALANRLAESVKQSGGRIRLDTPVLRLSYDSSGAAVGVDLLSGETVGASKAIVSNLTVWDTYGKLVGLNRTPAEIRKQINSLRGWGAYLLYLGVDEDAVTSLGADHLLAVTDWQDGQEDYDPITGQLFFAAAPAWDARAPEGKRAATVHAFTDVDEWFTFHRDETELEARDQEMLEQCWGRLHATMPELGSSVEVIETATPRTFYDLTRRKLGMVGGVNWSPGQFWLAEPAFATALPNLSMISDTTSPGGIAGLTRAGMVLANELSRK